MFVEFFIKRPIFASVFALVIMLAGAVSIPTLPIAQYPNVTPPQVSVTANYTGASAAVVESAVTTPLEQQINGVQGLKYVSSTSGNDGLSTINVTFELGRDLDAAAVDVQNRVSTAQGRLPNEVRTTGVTINKVSTSLVLAIGLGSAKGEYNSLFLSNYADLYIRDALKRVKGVGDVRIFGERKYSMRLWLDPNRLANRQLTALDVVNALREQNVQVAAGQIGQPPTVDGQRYQLSIRAGGRLKNPAEFGEVILKTGADGSLVKLRDVGRAELGAEDYSTFLRFNGREAVGLGIYQLPDANALDVAKGVKEQMDLLAKRFPAGMQYKVALDTTLAVTESIREVLFTLGEAILLVVLVIFVFLQNWRTTLIPALTIPVSLIGTFAFIKLFGFSINNLTLFGLTLATGLVVDDAIVVIENIARLMEEKGLRPMEAAVEAMGEVTGALIATALVLVAVFVPVAFFPGTTGQLYKQFALTIAFSVALSAFNALTLTPALSALLLNHREPSSNRFFDGFNQTFETARRGYRTSLRFLLRFKTVTLLLFTLSLGATYWLYQRVPGGFIPNEDQGYFLITLQGPQGVSLNYTSQAVKQVEEILLKQPEVVGVFAVGGFGLTGNGSNNATIFASLKPWEERKGPGQTLDGFINRIRGPLAGITDAVAIPFNPPAIQGLGRFGGFQFELQDQLGTDLNALAQANDTLIQKANAQPDLRGVFSSFKANTPQLVVEVDREKAKALGVMLGDIFSTLQAFLGSQYINDFDLGPRNYRVFIQADAPFRSNPEDIKRLYVRAQNGALVSLANLLTVTRSTAPQNITHYNLARSTEINGSAAPGVSSGQALQTMERLAQEVLPQGMTFAWSGISLEQIEGGSQAVIIFALGVVLVFLVLAAQYESLTDPLVILLSVPLAILGALFAQSLRGLSNDVFCQIGLVMLVGLASKNAVLIVEFANQLRERGLPLVTAAVEAAQTRLRPILMTSFAFILGIFPLVIAEGAGAASRNSLGTAVFGGMIVSTFLSLYIVPTLYVVVALIREQVGSKKALPLPKLPWGE
ncbi:efflux RND transporter permease subunit [Anthocerotibacter panamensis]|uniref:efflux RND transporter permease subunit n=1 Tax=Anthocerotibacter panamensis TaxID=2857077 RepID=UPI001C40537D|nr:efflux RND transporter permease subunit [Anthocerotibacter panamensis]